MRFVGRRRGHPGPKTAYVHQRLNRQAGRDGEDSEATLSAQVGPRRNASRGGVHRQRLVFTAPDAH